MVRKLFGKEKNIGTENYFSYSQSINNIDDKYIILYESEIDT